MVLRDARAARVSAGVARHGGGNRDSFRRLSCARLSFYERVGLFARSGHIVLVMRPPNGTPGLCLRGRASVLALFSFRAAFDCAAAGPGRLAPWTPIPGHGALRRYPTHRGAG